MKVQFFLSKPGSWGFLLHLEETTESRDGGNKSQSDSRNLTKKRTAWSYCTRVSPKVGPSQFNCHSWMFIRSLGSLGPGSTSLNPTDCMVRDCNPTQKKMTGLTQSMFHFYHLRFFLENRGFLQKLCVWMQMFLKETMGFLLKQPWEQSTFSTSRDWM